jgi:hypothetical protein|tara:strand:- start:2645 stop:3055 length:411 start_codon:yes stop_codon:yes gene_type:complete
MNTKVDLKRIYHPYTLWEDYKAGFYDNISGKEKQHKIDKVLEMFNSYSLTEKYMNKVIEEWVLSCEHNLTNESMNKIAYIGQGACCLYGNVPSTITMECWRLLSTDVQERSNLLALSVIKKWNNKNKNKQLCLNFD